MPTNYRQLFAVQAKNKNRLLNVNPHLNNDPGIYFFTRRDENGFRFAYIGQATHILDRLISHLSGYSQWIDLSIRKHGLFHAASNPYGWHVNFLNYPSKDLDKQERYWIKQYADEGYQLRNVSTGGQGEGKGVLDSNKPQSGYRQGVVAGYTKASKEISHLFDLHLDAKTKSDKPNKAQEKAMQKFIDFLNFHRRGDKNEEN